MQSSAFHLLLVLLHVHGVRTDWPLSTSSDVQLVGLFDVELESLTSSSPSIQSRAMFKAAISLAETYNITVGEQSISWRVARTYDEVTRTLARSCLNLSTENVIGIVSSGSSREAQLISQLARSIGIPVVGYIANDPDPFYRTNPSDK